MPRIYAVTIKGKKSVPLGLLCPECGGKLYAGWLCATTNVDEPGYCEKCDYVGYRHGGFDADVQGMLDAFLAQGKEAQ